MDRNYLSIHDYGHADLKSWADVRETHIAVAVAIWAVSLDYSKRMPSAIWDEPTPAEEDHVRMAVEEYLSHGDFEPEPDGIYRWGAGRVIVGVGVVP